MVQFGPNASGEVSASTISKDYVALSEYNTATWPHFATMQCPFPQDKPVHNIWHFMPVMYDKKEDIYWVPGEGRHYLTMNMKLRTVFEASDGAGWGPFQSVPNGHSPAKFFELKHGGLIPEASHEEAQIDPYPNVVGFEMVAPNVDFVSTWFMEVTAVSDIPYLQLYTIFSKITSKKLNYRVRKFQTIATFTLVGHVIKSGVAWMDIEGYHLDILFGGG